MSCTHDPKFEDPRFRVSVCLVCKADRFGIIGPTRTGILKQQRYAILLVNELIAQSKWFMVTPLPDNKWEFTVKDEPGLPLSFSNCSEVL